MRVSGIKCVVLFAQKFIPLYIDDWLNKKQIAKRYEAISELADPLLAIVCEVLLIFVKALLLQLMCVLCVLMCLCLCACACVRVPACVFVLVCVSSILHLCASILLLYQRCVQGCVRVTKFISYVNSFTYLFISLVHAGKVLQQFKDQAEKGRPVESLWFASDKVKIK